MRKIGKINSGWLWKIGKYKARIIWTKSRWGWNKTFKIWLKNYLKRSYEAFFTEKRGNFGYIWCGWNYGMKSDRSTAWDLLHCPRNRIESSFFGIGSIRTFHCILGFSAVPGREVGKRPFTHLGIVPEGRGRGFSPSSRTRGKKSSSARWRSTFHNLSTNSTKMHQFNHLYLLNLPLFHSSTGKSSKKI